MSLSSALVDRPSPTRRRAIVGGLALLLGAVAPSGAQSSRASRAAGGTASSASIHYVVLWRTELLARPDTAAPVLAWLDSGQVVTPELPETFQTGHARILVNGRRGWVDNGYIRRVVTMRETARVVDTMRVVRRTPAPRPGDPRVPDRVSPRIRP